MIFLQIVNSLPHYPVAQADAQTFPLSLILNEIEVPAALTWRVDLASARALACILRRLAAMLWTERFAMARPPAPAREARAVPRKNYRVAPTSYCSRKMSRAFVRAYGDSSTETQSSP